MTLYFNPYYDSSVFLTSMDCGLGKEYVGKEGLLSELELRAGLTIKQEDNTERVICYMRAMQDAIADARKTGGALFFEDSFSRDDFGTASLLLRWRDALVKVDWRGNAIGNSEKIEGLSKIEAHFNCPGTADRWRTIISEVAMRPILRPTDRIMVQCDRKDLEPLFEYLFEAINSHYSTPVVEFHPRVSSHMGLNDMAGYISRILSFKNEYEAHEWIASQNLACEDVVAEADQAILSDMLYTLGKPLIGASDEGIGAVMRLLPLGISLFSNPVDITVLQAYLQSPRTPLNKLHLEVTDAAGAKHYISVTRKLFDHICKNGGFGSQWQELIDAAEFDYSGASLSKADIDFARSFINMWELGRHLPAGEASVKDVTDFITNMSTWAGNNIIPDSDLKAQFMALQRYCSFMLHLLSGWSGATIPVDKLTKWATHVCEPINISSDYARLGSMNVVGSLGDIYSSPVRLIWYAATTDNTCPYEYDFLSRSEIRDLTAHYVLVPDKELMARLDKAYRKEGLIRSHDITIVTCERISGVETVQSALLAEFTSKPLSIPVTSGPVIAKTATGTVNTDTGKKAIHYFNPAILKGFARKRESYSSINTLIQSPLDYLLDYFKKYGQYGIDEVDDVPTTEGTMAHCYIETLGALCGNNPAAMMAKHKSDFDTLLDGIISEKGLILCLEENRLEEQSFRVGLRESIDVLLGIIIGNNLVIEGFEYEITAGIKPIGDIYAKIDCLLSDPSDGKAVIFDFKWNSGLTYQRKIEDNRELQLAVYRKVIETGGVHPDASGTIVNVPGRDVKFIGYYAIPRKTLFTPDNSLAPNAAIVEVRQENSRDIFKMACDGYVYRWAQLRRGELEEAEGLSLEDLDYVQDLSLYDLDADYDNNALKARAYGDKNITLKGGLI